LTRPDHHVTFRQYLRRRLGPLGGRSAWFNFFIRPFGAPSFAVFWRRWNPVYGYFLYYYSYRPLTRLVPRTMAMMITFVACGFVLHDLPAWMFARRVLPPGATIAFFFFGLGAIASESMRMDLSGWPVAGRAAVNVAYLASSVALMLLIVRLLVAR
jgi:hypothetical protein